MIQGLTFTHDIDGSVVDVEGHQEGTAKGYNSKKPGNPCYNIQFAFCYEIKAYLTRYVRSGDTYTSNGATGLIKEIMAHLEEEGLEVTFHMDSGYFDEEILETNEALGCRYVIKAKGYPGKIAYSHGSTRCYHLSRVGKIVLHIRIEYKVFY